MNISEAKAFETMQREMVVLKARIAILEHAAEMLDAAINRIEAKSVEITVEPIKRKPGRPRKLQ